MTDLIELFHEAVYRGRTWIADALRGLAAAVEALARWVRPVPAGYVEGRYTVADLKPHYPDGWGPEEPVMEFHR